jgi:hypothetical protein
MLLRSKALSFLTSSSAELLRSCVAICVRRAELQADEKDDESEASKGRQLFGSIVDPLTHYYPAMALVGGLEMAR